MNRIYRLVFNRAFSMMQVAPETARGRGKSRGARRTLLAGGAALAVAADPVWAQAIEIIDGNHEVVDGSGTTGTQASPWNILDDLYVGHSDSGMLTILNGGMVSNDSGVIGDEAGSTGTVTVTDKGSKWSNARFDVGRSGSGTLYIEDGGKVSSASSQIGHKSGSTGTVTVTGEESEWINNVSLSVGGSGNGTLTISNGGTVSNAYYGYIGHKSGSTGTVTVTGLGSEWINAGELAVGLGGTGELNIEDGGRVSSADSAAISARDGSTSTVTVTGEGSEWIDSNRLYVGYDGNGTLNIEDGGRVSNIYGHIGHKTGSTGTVTVTEGSEWINDGDLVVGQDGTGELTIEDGGRVINNNGVIGDEAGSTGTVTVTGEDSEWINSSGLDVGNGGSGTLTIEDGGMVSSSADSYGYDSYIGLEDNSTGTVTVTGKGSEWISNVASLFVGYEGSGTLNIEDGGRVSNKAGFIGLIDATGTVTVTGEGSEWINSSSLSVGDSGSGTLTIEDGGRVSSADSHIGYGALSTGTVTVTGEDSEWSNSSSLAVGDSGSGTLTIEDGGRVSSADSHIGYGGLSTGTVTVTGEESEWSNDASLAIGNEGSGTLTIENGGRVSSADSYIGFEDGSTGTVTVTGEGSEWINNVSLTVGRSGNGTLTIEDGGMVSSADSHIGHKSGSTGTVTVTGEGSEWINADDLMVGAGDSGTLTISNGGTVSNAGSIIGVGGGSTGTLQLSGTNGARGVLETGYVEEGDGTADFTFDGGILRATSDEADFLRNFDAGDVTIDNSGAFIDSNGHDIGIATNLQGSGGLSKLGDGTLTLAGDSTFTGGTIVRDGTLSVTGTLGDIASVENGATLSGTGTVGDTTVSDGGTLAPGNSIGTLMVDGDLTLSSGSILAYELGGPGTQDDPAAGISDRIDVAGDLTLDGTLDLAQSEDSSDGEAGVGYYRLMTYGGELTDSGLDVGDTPTIENAGAFELDAGGGNVDLYIAALGADTLQHWQGGDGTWNTSTTHWLNQSGDTPVTWAGHHAVFKHLPGDFDGGTVAVDGTQSFEGLQFIDDGYRLAGDGALETVADGSELRVLAERAEIATEISGTGGVTKTEAGTLVLSGNNTYTGGTRVAAGQLIGDTDSLSGDLDLSTGGRATFAQQQNGEYHGQVTGSGALQKTGEGTLHLSGDSRGFDGTTQVNAGHLSVANQLGGTLAVNHGGTLSGNGTVGDTTVADGGTLAPGSSIGTLTVDGGLTLSSGSILAYELGGPGAQDDPTVGISDRIDVANDLTLDGTLDLAQSEDSSDGEAGVGYYRLMTYGGELTDNGLDVGDTPDIENAGAFELDAGGGNVDLYIAALGADTLQHWQGGDGTWSTSTTHWQNQGGETPETWAGHHAVFKHPPGDVDGGTVAVDGTQSFAGLQFIDTGYRLAGDGALETAADGSELRVLAERAEIATEISGAGGVTKTEAGTLVLGGDSGSFTGMTRVVAGGLVVDGTLGGHVAVTGGSLGGNGRVGDVTVTEGGTVAPGHSIDTLQVNDIAFEAGSVYDVEVDKTGRSDRIEAGGTATLEGGAVRVRAENGRDDGSTYAANTRYDILSAEGGVTGTFDSVIDDFAFLDASLGYGAEEVTLNLARNDTDFDEVIFPEGAALTANQRAAARGAESTGQGHTVYDAVAALPDDEGRLRGAFDALSGELYASVTTALVEDSRLVREAANDRLRAASGAMIPADVSHEITAAATTWVSGIGQWGHHDGDGNAASLDRDTQGVLAGVDAQATEQLRVGGIIGYTQSDLTAGAGRGSASVDSFHVGAYAGSELGDSGVELRGGAFYGYHEIDTSRGAAVGEWQDTLDDDGHAHTWHADVELSRAFELGATSVEPYVNLAHVHQRSGEGRESGGDAALIRSEQRHDTTYSTLGLRTEREITWDEGTVTLSGDLGWQHAYGDRTPEVKQRFSGGETFRVSGTPLPEESVVAGAGIETSLGERTSLHIDYAGHFGGGVEDHGGKATLEWRF